MNCLMMKNLSCPHAIQFFLSQNFHVAEQFTGQPGSYVPVEETIKGFAEILEGKYDDLQKKPSAVLDELKMSLKKRKNWLLINQP